MTQRETLENWQRAGRTVIHEADAKDLLQRIGIPVPRRDPDHGRCAAKLCHDDYPHKSDHGLVRLGLSPEEAKQVFEALSKGGDVTMPIGETFFSPAFGMLRDEFGIPWIVNTQTPE